MLGEVISDGIELDLYGNIISNVLFDFVYIYIDVKIVNDIVNLDWWVKLLKGSLLFNIFKYSVNV